MRKYLWRVVFVLALAAALVFPAAVMAAPPVVKTVPWVANIPLIPHDTWSGKSIRLKGTAAWPERISSTAGISVTARRTATGAVTPTSTASKPPTPTPARPGRSSPRGLRSRTRPPGRPAARNTRHHAGQDARRRSQRGDRRGALVPAQDHDPLRVRRVLALPATTAETPASLNAFFVNGHLETGDPNNPYTETVQRGMRRLFTLLYATAIGHQTYPAPLERSIPTAMATAGHLLRESYTYAGGIYMDAIVASGTPDAVAPDRQRERDRPEIQGHRPGHGRRLCVWPDRLRDVDGGVGL